MTANISTQPLPREPKARAQIRLALRIWRERKDLRNANPELLRDIGLTAEEAAREARRRFWDLPRNRR